MTMTWHAAEGESGTVSVQGLSHVYRTATGETPALEDIAFDVAPGRFVSIVGPSGCGKSSLLMMLAGLVTPTDGIITTGGQPLVKPDPTRIGVVFQEPSLYPWMTARGNVEFPLKLRGIASKTRRERAEAALELVGLDDFAGRYPNELSGGMKQRVSIARGLVQDPPIMLMDEPFAALDEQTRMAMGDELLRIWERTRKTILFVTHGLSEAVHLADEVIVLSSRPGRIVDRVEIDLPRPRDVDSMETARFSELRQRIWRKIRG